MTETVLTVGSWFYLVGSFHENEGLHLYINGLLEAMNDLPSSSDITETDWNAHIGVKDQGGYGGFPVNAIVDDFKYYYTILNSVGKFILFYSDLIYNIKFKLVKSKLLLTTETF